MAAITSAQSGLSNVGSTWVGGVVPVEGDNVTIAATHVVTITGTHIWGNDTATAALTIAGSCVFSTVANSDLTLKGTMVNSGTAAVWRRGTIASPMPSNITSKVRTNYSATLANNKYNISFGSTTAFAEWSECGATRNRQFQVASAISAGATSITVSDATGWKVGDIIFLEATNTTAAQREHRVLTSVSGNVVGWTTGLTNARIAGAWGGNLSSNVLWQSFSGSFGAYVQVLCQTTQALATINIKQVSFHGMFGQGDVAGFSIGGNNAVSVANSAVGIIDNITSCDLLPDGTNAACNTGNGQFGVRLGYSGNWTYPVVYTRLTGFAVYTSSGGTGYFNNAFFNGLNSPIISQFSQGGAGCKIVNSRITNVGQLNGGASMIGFSMENVTMDGTGAIVGILQGDYTINNCLFGQVYGISGSTLITNNNNSLSTLTFTNCLFPSGRLMVSPTTYQNALANKPVTILNKNASVTQQEIYLNTGSIIRDNSQLIRSRSSIKFSPYIANTPHGYSFNISALSGIVTRFKFGLRYDTTYGTSTPPSVTVSGLGITPQTFTAGGSANTDYTGLIEVTPTSSGLLTITITGQTTATLGTGNYWFSGISINPWIDWTQWYGYVYAPTSSTLTIDHIVVLSESAASALSGISYSSGTLSISGSLTISNVYDWLKWYESANRLDPIITSTDGKNFNIASNVLVLGTLTIPDGSQLTPTGTFTLNGSLFGTINSNVTQDTPTNLTGVAITGNLTYNTNTPITITLTDCTISGTISNSGTGLVTISLGNSTIGTIGANIATRPVTSLNLTGLIAGSQIYIADGAGDQIAYVSNSGTSYTLATTGQTGVWSVKVARYGYISQTGSHLPAIASTTLLITLAADPYITEATKDTVANYTTLENLDKLYDYSAYYETLNDGIPYSRIITKAGTAASAGIYDVILNNTGSIWSFDGSTLSIYSTDTLASGTTISGALYTSGNVTLTTAQSDTKITANVLQSVPTDLLGMVITGNLTYNYDSDISVNFTDCVITGTIENSNTGIIKVFRVGSSLWFTEGTNVLVRANVEVTTVDGLALTTAILKNGSEDLGWIPQDVARVLEIAQGETFSIYAIAYGYQADLFSATSDDFTSFRIALNPEIYIDTTLDITTRDIIVSSFSSYRDDNFRLPFTINSDLRNYSTAEVLNALHYYIVSQAYWVGTAVVFGAPINGFTFIQGGIYIADSNYYWKVSDDVTTPTNLGYLLPIVIGVDSSVYTAYPSYSPVEMNTSDIVMQYAPWTHITAEISTLDKNDIRDKVWTADNRILNNQYFD